jgi:hypothetical protein
MVTARGGQSASTISSIAPATFWALALHSRMTLAEPSRNWIRYCIVKVELGDDARPRSRYTQSAVVAPSPPHIDADSLARHVRRSKREPTRFKRPAGDRAAMNKHHPYALGDDPPSPLPICRHAPWQCRAPLRAAAICLSDFAPAARASAMTVWLGGKGRGLRDHSPLAWRRGRAAPATT